MCERVHRFHIQYIYRSAQEQLDTLTSAYKQMEAQLLDREAAVDRCVFRVLDFGLRFS